MHKKFISLALLVAFLAIFAANSAQAALIKRVIPPLVPAPTVSPLVISR